MTAKKLPGDVKEFTVKRSKWSRGQNDSQLLARSGQMCCLGFYAKACGLKKKDIVMIGTPQELKDFWETKLIDRSGCDTHTTNKIITTNDDDELTDIDREKQLKKAFGKLKIKVNFED